VRLVTLLEDGRRSCGLVVGDEVVELGDPAVGLPSGLVDVLALGVDARPALARAARSGARRVPLDGARLGAPVHRPPAFLGIARNYLDHIAELGVERPTEQTWFAKLSTCVVGPGDAVEVPSASVQVDYEGELGVVIGRRCRHVPVDRALEVVAGYTVVNDVSVRDWQRATPTMLLGKGFDTHGPMGPWVVTADELPDPQALAVRTRVNGELRQDGTTADMIFTVAEMIAHLSTVATLEPGTVLATGTPAGVGAATDPPRWLVAGDTVEVEVEGVGVLVNPIVDERIPHGAGPGDAGAG
jgi:2-keto-4-pentenoate hydratase/2-oxohepta-3-ene-1,7-dioic acid hydratase in catechol pathway